MHLDWEELILEYILEITVRGFSDATVESYKYKLGFNSIFFKDRHISPEQVKKIHVKELILWWQKKGLENTTINTGINMFKKLFDYCVEEGYTVINPVQVKNLPEKKKIIYPLNENEIKQLLIVAKSHPYELLRYRNTVIFMLMLDCGLRISEVSNLNEDDILQKQIRILNSKGNKERAVVLSPFMQKELIKYLRVKKRLGLCNHALIVTYENKRMSKQNVWQIMRIISKKVNIRTEVRFSPHTLRHTYASMQLKNGLDIFTLSLNMGHSNVGITQDYIKSLNSEDFINKSLKTSTLMNLK